MVIYYLISAFIGYLLGSLNLAYLLGKSKGFDIREYGSNNAGTSNATITMGLKAGVLVGLHDILKSCIAVLIVTWLFPNLAGAGAIAGAMAVFGHIFSIFLDFRGGKGFAPFLGVVLAFDWKFFLALLVIIILVSLITDYIVMGTFTTIIVFPIYLYLEGVELNTLIPIVIASLIIFLKHFENIKKIFKGEEIGVRSAFSKKNKIS